jgi:putative heme iron utilization protein
VLNQRSLASVANEVDAAVAHERASERVHLLLACTRLTLTMTNDAPASPATDRFASLHLASLEDQPIRAPSHAEQARTLAARLSNGTLGTLCRDPRGYPYGSSVTVAFDAGRPVLLMSELDEHTKHLHHDPRASLLVADSCVDDPLANARMTMLGECWPAPDTKAAAKVFLARHPEAAYYADFDDFAYWRVELSAIRFVGGYGGMSWVSASDYFAAQPDPLGPHAVGIIKRMNEDHRAALPLYCRAFSSGSRVSEATMTGIDRYGFEVTAKTPDGPRPLRFAFAEPIHTPTQARRALAELLHRARTKLGTHTGA